MIHCSTDPGDEVSCLVAERVVGSGLGGTICVSTAVLLGGQDSGPAGL